MYFKLSAMVFGYVRVSTNEQHLWFANWRFFERWNWGQEYLCRQGFERKGRSKEFKQGP